jgi:predicted MFS family arabinose efflux permease
LPWAVSAGLAIGGVLGILLGGTLEQLYGWRIAFMVVGVPGFLLALLASRLIDPSGRGGPVPVRPYVKEEGFVTTVLQFYPLILSVVIGVTAAFVLDWHYGEDSRADVAAFGAIVGIGVVMQIWFWVRSIRMGKLERTPFGHDAGTALDGLLDALQRVLRTPTLVYVFIAGAMISFGMNGLVGWGPTFITRELGLSSGEAARLLGVTGLVAGVSGTLAGGLIADWWLKRNPRAGADGGTGAADRRTAGGMADDHARPRDVPGMVRRRLLLPVVVQRALECHDLRRGPRSDQRHGGRRLLPIHSPGR